MKKESNADQSEKHGITSSGYIAARCEDCMYFDYDEEFETEVCGMDLDEDEMERYMVTHRSACPYFRFYDEYKSVQKQN